MDLDLPFIKTNDKEGLCSKPDNGPTIPEVNPTTTKPACSPLVEPTESLPTSPDKIPDLRNEILTLVQMKKLGRRQRKRLRELNTELASLEDSQLSVAHLYPTTKEQAREPSRKDPNFHLQPC